MSYLDVIHDYVGDVIRHVPRAARTDVGFELRELLTESLAERARREGRPADDAMVLAVLREFGAPAEVAARYQAPMPVLLPPEQTRGFLRLALAGIALQWAATLPAAASRGTLGGWWFSAGLGAFWWPGVLIMGHATAPWLRRLGLISSAWQPRTVDRERVDRTPALLGVAVFTAGMSTLIALPWLASLLPAAAAEAFAFDPAFLRGPALPAIPLWAAALGVRVQAMRGSRWSAALRTINVALSVAFVGLLAWWSIAGKVFLAASTDASAKAVFGLVIVIVLADLVVTLVRRRPRITAPTLTR